MLESLDVPRLRAAYDRVKAELIAERTPNGHWVGELSSSALATATAVSALAAVRNQGSGFRVQGSGDRRQERSGTSQPIPASTQYSVLSTQHSTGGDCCDASIPDLDDLIARGFAYLATQQNPDGGFGDTDLSHSNIATTYLVVAALHLAGLAADHGDLLRSANAYIDSKGGLAGLRERYGIDKTFVVPIMTNLALAGLLDWRQIDPLPFELACVPQSLYRFVGMPVVSYAIPALVAIGQARYFYAPPRNPITRLIRWLSISRSLKVLRQMQPDSGGYLEATPLTAFVVMSLASCGPLAPRVDKTGSSTDQDSISRQRISGNSRSELPTIIHHGVKFLAASIRPDGSWPIDTNLATWNTTLAINALAGAGEDVFKLLGKECLDWLLSCQHMKRHPFTGANPGGFGWSNLSGAVPDADDTPGALLAIGEFLTGFTKQKRAGDDEHQFLLAASHRHVAGVRWLLRLQNGDGGWPTFCRGWGKLPFDRSGADLTAHALRGISAADPICDAVSSGIEIEGSPRFEFDGGRVIERARQFLTARQLPDGSWLPLWFGNQDHPREENPVYGTAKVLKAYSDLLMDMSWSLTDEGVPGEVAQLPEVARGVGWLVNNQNGDGGWGSGVWKRNHQGSSITSTAITSSVEETALAVEALISAYPLYPLLGTEDGPMPPLHPSIAPAVARGLNWLIDRVEAGQHRQPAPIGFYFAKLWYYERLYPLTFTVAALGRACLQLAPAEDSGNTEQPHATRAT